MEGSSREWSRGPGGPRADTGPGKLEAFVICVDLRCGYYQGFSDIRDAPEMCPRCGGPLLRECAACHMLLRTFSATCLNCGRPIGLSSPKGR